MTVPVSKLTTNVGRMSSIDEFTKLFVIASQGRSSTPYNVVHSNNSRFSIFWLPTAYPLTLPVLDLHNKL
uniref:Uncharacterized protein n=1 Tax=Setaria digitata TaxID=48799 RepID=A0A915PTQ5_9BILA